MQDTILSISGRPGLYKLVAHGNSALIVEEIAASKRRMTVGARERVTSLNDVSIYTTEDDVPLMQVFENIKDKFGAGKLEISHKTTSKDELAKFMEDVLPNYDRDRVHTADMKKLIQWYNILAGEGFSEFVEKETEKPEQAAEEAETKAE